MLEQCCNHSKQCRNNVATLCCAENRHAESSSVTVAKKCTKKVFCTCKVAFLIIRPIVVFSLFSLPSPVKVMLHGRIRNDNFWPNTELQYWNNVATIRNNVATMMQRCFVLKIVVASRFV